MCCVSCGHKIWPIFFSGITAYEHIIFVWKWKVSDLCYCRLEGVHVVGKCGNKPTGKSTNNLSGALQLLLYIYFLELIHVL
jgi:hypothetical protein